MRMKPLTPTLYRLLTLAGLIVMASGCSSGLTREECQVVDWRSIGYEDGIRGRSQGSISGHRKACAKHGVAMDLAAYREGWDEGIGRYCQPGNGYQRGRRGSAYNAVCPRELEAAFLDAYREGRELHDLQAEVQRLTHAVNNSHKRIAELETAIVDTGITLVSPGVTTEQRVVMLDELRRMEQERSAIREDIPALEQELARQQEQLAIVSADRRY